MPPILSRSIQFGSFLVNPQVFYVTSLSFALVNLKPLLPGHVLVSPLRVVPRVSELSAAEMTDLFLTVQRVSRMVERVFKASALNIAIQDGVDAGQSIPHVHAHIIPRQKSDLEAEGGTDAIYDKMNGEQGNIAALQRHYDAIRKSQNSFPKIEDAARKHRSLEAMQKEAEWLFDEMQKEQPSN